MTHSYERCKSNLQCKNKAINYRTKIQPPVHCLQKHMEGEPTRNFRDELSLKHFGANVLPSINFHMGRLRVNN